MPANKEAYLRYHIIDACISSKYKPYPSMQDIIDACSEKLGKQFNVSTIQKDIKAMKEDELLNYHAPIKYSKSHEGYYYTDKDFTIKMVNLSENDIDTLKTAVDILSNYSKMNVSTNFANAVDKILASVKENFPEKGRAKRIIQTDTTENHHGFEFFDFFIDAIKRKLPVSFIHYSYSNRAFKSNIIHPYFLKEFKNNWYIIGFSEQHQEIRTFGLDRVYDPIKLNRSFHDDTEGVADMYFKNIYGVYPIKGRKVEKVVFKTSPLMADYINAHPIHSSQTKPHEYARGVTVFTLNIIPSFELLNLFMSYSHSLEVDSPLWFKQLLTTNIAKAHRIYED